MKTYKNYEELEKELRSDKEVQHYGGLTPVYDKDYNEVENTYTFSVKTKYGSETRTVKVLEDED